MKKKILILGKGFLGNRINDLLNSDDYIINLSDARVYSFEDVERLIEVNQPDILINCIGSTGRDNVDDCENDVHRTLYLNAFLPFTLSEACIRRNIKFVHISSGCIYHSSKKEKQPGMIGEITFMPDTEGARIHEFRPPDFFDLFYSRTKIYAEQGLLPLCQDKNILILRIRIPLDCIPHPKNVLTKLIKYKTIIDVPNSVTYIPDFVKTLDFLLEKDARGIYNVVNSGECRYPDLMYEYAKRVLNAEYEVIPYEKLELVRTNLLLATDRLKGLGFPVRDINDVYEECVDSYVTEQSKKALSKKEDL